MQPRQSTNVLRHIGDTEPDSERKPFIKLKHTKVKVDTDIDTSNATM